MKLTVKNFGPIREANAIKIGPMTIFVGPSNVGKSYLATLIYSITRALDESMEYGRFVFQRNRRLWARIREWEKEQTKSPEKRGYISQYKSQQIEKVFPIWVGFSSSIWKDQVVRCFGTEGQNIMEDHRLAVTISNEENDLILDLCSPDNSKLSSGRKKALLKLMNDNKEFKKLSDMLASLEEHPEAMKDEEESVETLYYRLNNALAEILFPLFRATLLSAQNITSRTQTQSHYLPAIRGGIMQSHRTLVSALIQNAPMAGLRATSPIPLFTGVLSDFMEKLIDIGNPSKINELGENRARISMRKNMEKLGEAIEQKIMRGKIAVETSETQYPDFQYTFKKNGNDYDLPLMSASSMVSELAPVSLFIKYYVNPGDLFVVEEPEAHLHPDAQDDISNILVQLVNAGIRVLVTTHSDCILEHISNYVHASDLNKKIKGQALEEEKISTYVFDQQGEGEKKGTLVKKVEFNDETGILTEDHMDASSALYNKTVDLFNERNRRAEKDEENDT